MPLVKAHTRKAREKNIETEIKAGKPRNQAIAIAYSVAKKNKQRPKKK